MSASDDWGPGAAWARGSYVPTTAVSGMAAPEGRLFDHLVGAREQDRRDIETQGPCRLQVDHELELGPLLDRQIGWLCPFEDLVDEDGGAVPHIFETNRIGEQATHLGHLPESADQRQTVARRCLRYPSSRGDESRIIQHEDGVGRPRPHQRETRLEVF